MQDRQVQVEIHGRVQGVGYRAWLQQVASMFGLSGWTRNRHDGWVEAVLSGPPPVVEAALVMIEKGPQGARVENVAVRPADAADLAAGPSDGSFAILPDH
jgi:acylphosphatase